VELLRSSKLHGSMRGSAVKVVQESVKHRSRQQQEISRIRFHLRRRGLREIPGDCSGCGLGEWLKGDTGLMEELLEWFAEAGVERGGATTAAQRCGTAECSAPSRGKAGGCG